MSKTILIVDSDAHVSSSLAAALEARGFQASETGDGKAAVDLVRTGRPDLVVLAVELSAGQNGYLVCGKLKKDDDLKDVPIIITGNPDGFAQHRKLKAHADDYVAKPVDPADLVERVGAIIGFPAAPSGGALVDDGIPLAGLDDDGEAIVTDFGGDEITLDGDLAPVAGPDDGLDLLDAAFDGISDPAALGGDAPAETTYVPEQDLGALDHLGGMDEEEDDALARLTPPPAPAPRPPSPPARSSTPVPLTTPLPRTTGSYGLGGADAAELRSLRARVAELQHALDDAQAQSGAHEVRVRELEAELDAKAAEVETARAAGGRNDRETFALREAANRKDKEILRLKTELNGKEQELLELRDREVQLEQRASESGEEIARRDAQLKTLTARLEVAAADKRRSDGLLAQAKEEARGAVARLAALQADAEQVQALSAEVEALRAQLGELEAQGQQQAEQARAEAAQERARAQAGERELEALRRRAAELEEQAGRHEERLTRLYGRLKQDERLRDKARKALQVAQQLLEEEAPGAGGDDEEAAA